MTPRKILVTGGAGFIGSAVVRQAIRDGHAVVNVDALTYAACLANVARVADHPAYAFEHADIRDAEAMARIFAAHRPDAVMHLAAESHVDRSIDGPGAFIDTNVRGTYVLLEAARAWWSAAGRPGGFRWVFSAHGANFVKTMLRLGASRDSLSVVDDQIGGPTPAAAIAAACLTLAQALQETPALSGTHHLSGAPDVSWAGFAAAIMEAAGLGCRITPIPSRDYPQKAPRPANSRLDCTSLTEAFGIPRPDWRTGLAQLLAELETTA